ncbi:MBL fold metallo-hydrolase [Candidatus Amarobacter glycogenicus]|uniref:MBL fold metallo-hydrolase n=1 Tax=Candidatus Amarobacter glycogenicus TaxID=3140699 RepID=UPI003136D369|nr:MBL fold metallo-hydrolase [Dehalococcoidia bacterium]
MQISESVRAALVPDENPMHPDFTCIYLVGAKGQQSLTIDSGEAIDRYQWFLRGYLAAVEKEEIGVATITHHHSDHSGNLKWAKEFLKADISIPANGRALLKGRLPAKVDTLKDGDVIELDGGVRVQVMATPGHSVDSLCYYIEEEGVLFTGDTLLGSSTTTVWELASYRKSLERLLALPNLKVICPGHGKIVHDPRERLQMYVNHRNMRENQILKVLEGGGAVSSWDIMLQLYPDIHKQLRRAADSNVRSHLKQLADDGRIKVYEGKPRRARPAAARERDVEHVRQRDLVIKQAKKFDTEKRRNGDPDAGEPAFSGVEKSHRDTNSVVPRLTRHGEFPTGGATAVGGVSPSELATALRSALWSAQLWVHGCGRCGYCDRRVFSGRVQRIEDDYGHAHEHQ